MLDFRKEGTRAGVLVVLPYVALFLMAAVYQWFPYVDWRIVGSLVAGAVALFPHLVVWCLITDADKTEKVAASLSLVDARARSAIVFPFFLAGYFVVPLVLLLMGRNARQLPGVFHLLFGVNETLSGTSYSERIILLLGEQRNSEVLACKLGARFNPDDELTTHFGRHGSTKVFLLSHVARTYCLTVNYTFNFLSFYRVDLGSKFGFLTQPVMRLVNTTTRYAAKECTAAPVSLPLWVSVDRHYPKGMLLSTYCDGYDLWAICTDGKGGTYEALQALEHPNCGATLPATPAIAHQPV